MKKSIQKWYKGNKESIPDDEIEKITELKPISIRLQKGLIMKFKDLAEDKGIGYQTLIRSVLNEYLHERF